MKGVKQNIGGFTFFALGCQHFQQTGPHGWIQRFLTVQVCGTTLAVQQRPGTVLDIIGHLRPKQNGVAAGDRNLFGRGEAFEKAMVSYSRAYADQNEADYEMFLKMQ